MGGRWSADKSNSSTASQNTTTNQAITDAYNYSSSVVRDSGNTTNTTSSFRDQSRTTGSYNTTTNKTVFKFGDIFGGLPPELGGAIGTAAAIPSSVSSDMASAYQAAMNADVQTSAIGGLSKSVTLGVVVLAALAGLYLLTKGKG